MSSGGTLFWTAVGFFGLILLIPDSPPAAEPAKPAPARPFEAEPEEAPDRRPGIGNGFAAQELVREPDGHFYAEGQVNGARVRFLIDTGATMVVLTADDAQRAGIPLGLDREMVMGAGGPVEMVPVTIDRIAVGSLSATQHPAAVAPDLPISLLGQSFLAQIGTVEISGDRMVLR